MRRRAERRRMVVTGLDPMTVSRERCYVAETFSLMSKNTKNSTAPNSKRHEDDAGFRRTASEVDRQRAGEARGHDDQGGSRQNEARDYDQREGRGASGGSSAGSEKPDTSGTHSDARYARERYGEQSAEERRDSMRKEQPANLGGQDSRDQSTEDQHSLLGRRGDRGERSEEEVSRRQRESEGAQSESRTGAEPESHASETRENLSREYAERRQKEAGGRTAPGSADYDGNWTKDTDKPSQPGPARGDARPS